MLLARLGVRRGMRHLTAKCTRRKTRVAFEEAVDDYLQTCKQTGKAPQKPYSGKIMLRVPPELHARVAIIAEAHGKSLNLWVTDLLASAEG